MQQQSIHQQKIVEFTNQGEYVQLEDYIRVNQTAQMNFSQALVECIYYTRDSEEHLQCIQQILKQQIDFNYKDNQGNTALIQAAKSGKISILNEIIKYKEKFEKKQFKLALDIAIQSEQDNWDIVETLLQLTSLEKPQHLIKSLRKGNFKTAQKIIEQYGASGQDENGDTALHVASRLGNLQIIKSICQKENLYKKKNQQHQTPLDVAYNQETRNQLIEEEIQFQKSPNRKRKQEELVENNQNSQKSSKYEDCCEIFHKPPKVFNDQAIQTENKEKKDSESQIPEHNYINQPFYDQLISETIVTLPQHRTTLDDIVKQLSFEINTFSQELNKLLEEQRPIIDKIVQMVDEIVQTVSSKSRAFLYGSCYTGLNLLDSDIDIVIETNEQERISLYKIAEQFKIQGFIKDVKVIDNARKPVLKMQCSQEFQNKLIDITISKNDHSGRKTANSMIEFQKEFKQFKSLALILKFYFKSINLLNAYQGGLNSYCILTMILALLQIKRVRDTDNEEIGKTFLDFFDLYSQDIDYFNKIINIVPSQSENMQVDEPNIYQQQFPQFDQGQQELVILDLHNKGNNIASSTFKIKHIKNALSLGYSAILNSQKCEEPCFFSRYNKPVCCILKQIIQQSKNHHLTGVFKSKQPFYFFNYNNTY
ncbi:unnamed protein product (macronuclear) [Paramecium tetraurelia]|uniref:Poly(A) RNA polymerase mitochondrial-like central palm domain-containing protein n=1 Tax=Paramecium tetraurelia TaxID=5888 RepID=A0EAI9_PARTE|nr:uncharacterized protein GSPATT00025039001 [Paramecium tetraurelia]CAK92306.1 unnamed protein product [Paramecium tetraurelia]|eukprot:XP_001459703.1 hypothetical protein (macronuclear) [Paramecium tetraurelia strain d4-2]